jgi:hypothetical protein
MTATDREAIARLMLERVGRIVSPVMANVAESDRVDGMASEPNPQDTYATAASLWLVLANNPGSGPICLLDRVTSYNQSVPSKLKPLRRLRAIIATAGELAVHQSDTPEP